MSFANDNIHASMGEKRSSIIVKVPATVANIGSGFDAIGMALDIWNTLTVRACDEYRMQIVGEGEEELPRNDQNLVIHGMKAAYTLKKRLMEDKMDLNLAPHIIYTEKYLATEIPNFEYICENHIPFGRGMGSSSAAIVSGLIAGLVLEGVVLADFSKEILLNIACAIEGHPDNVAPTLYGGIQVGVKAPTYPQETPTHITKPQVHWTTSRVPISHKLQCIIFVPNFSVQTSVARAVLPDMVPREDAIFNLSRTALLVQAFVTGSFELLKIAMDDRLHQPMRAEATMPHIPHVIQAAVSAGAYGACLAGAGPSILAFAKGDHGDIYQQLENQKCNQKIGDAMMEAAQTCGITGKLFIIKPTHKGAYLGTNK